MFWYGSFAKAPLRELQWVVLLPALFGVVMLVGWIAELRALPEVAVPPRSVPEPEFRMLARPRLQRKALDSVVLGELVSIPVLVVAVWFLPHEFERWPSFSGRAFVLFVYAYFAYTLVAHVVHAVGLGREWLAEARLARSAEATLGRVVDQTPNGKVPNRITYDFRDGFNTLRRGYGKDYSDLLFEGMQVAVLYDPDDPSWNLPACGLNFHILVQENPVVTAV